MRFILVISVMTSSARAGQLSFTNVTDLLDVGDVEHRHFGICLVDINDDGWIDIYYANGRFDPDVEPTPSGVCPDLKDTPTHDPMNLNVCYLNRGDGTFGADIAGLVGIDDYWNAMRNVWGDYDNDGRRDLFSHNFLVSPLYHAVPAPSLLFEDASGASDLEVCLTKGTGAALVDLDNDGLLDVYAVEYDPSRDVVEHVNLMYINDGDGRFTDITSEAGVDLPDNPMGVTFADYDNDGDQDVFVANSHDPPQGAPSRLYRNDGVNPETGVPHFTDVAPEAGVDVVGGIGRGFGVAWGDYNNDGRLDLLYSRERDSRLFRNDGPDKEGIWTFTDVTATLDLAGSLFQDANFADLDNDGWLDILAANRTVGAQDGHNSVFLNNGDCGPGKGDCTWQEVAGQLGMDLPLMEQMGVVPGDIDNDGDIDVSWLSRGEGQPNSMFRNEGTGNNWIQFRLTGTVSNRDAVGARVQVTARLQPGDPPITQIREVVAGTGFFSDIPRIQTLGLGQANQVISAMIRWPSGQVQSLGSLAVNQRYHIVEAACPADLDGAGDQVCDRPVDFNAFRGFYDSGDLNSLLESDDDKLCYNPGIVLFPTEAPITLDFFGSLPNDSPASLDVTIESSANTVGLELTISSWNFNTDSWDVVGTATQSLNDDMVRTFAGNPADHVELGTGEVRTRYEVRVVSLIFLFPWLDCVDQVFWTTTN